MLNNHEHDDRNDLGQNSPVRGGASDRPIADRPLTDREVPLPGMAAADDPSSVAIHQWLDGELPEADARRFDSRQVDMWLQVAGETDRRRRMVTPSHLSASIMNALPEKQMATTVAAATATAAVTTSTVGMSMTTVLLIGAAMLALGIVVGKTL